MGAGKCGSLQGIKRKDNTIVRWQLLIRRSLLQLKHADDTQDHTSQCLTALRGDMATWNWRQAKGSQGQGPNAPLDLEQIILTLSLIWQERG